MADVAQQDHEEDGTQHYNGEPNVHHDHLSMLRRIFGGGGVSKNRTLKQRSAGLSPAEKLRYPRMVARRNNVSLRKFAMSANSQRLLEWIVKANHIPDQIKNEIKSLVERLLRSPSEENLIHLQIMLNVLVHTLERFETRKTQYRFVIQVLRSGMNMALEGKYAGNEKLQILHEVLVEESDNLEDNSFAMLKMFIHDFNTLDPEELSFKETNPLVDLAIKFVSKAAVQVLFGTANKRESKAVPFRGGIVPHWPPPPPSVPSKPPECTTSTLTS
ncbi:CUN053 hypothetical protein [Culex nigripalpus nucleopolyhedrovirus]|uniref:Uncharacterized protein n=1 Tax=Culex nigripalpus nucleopolyhedrovirus (isolate Florida/1997) TaxID=645993 RepID=Q919M2_NPVCO|nr:CUN053 hypothetical protein [Culex nigripalpus nucleopolyhedrovirus]AAK94131.1 CUN053 hypothetical protein [Culex nigripalpus nucleopolyhedrovirus]